MRNPHVFSTHTIKEKAPYLPDTFYGEHYLSMAVKQSSGQTVKNLIDKAVITDIKVLLRHSELSVAQIADRLEFPSCSFMCKYFRAHTGTTPLHYRNGNLLSY